MDTLTRPPRARPAEHRIPTRLPPHSIEAEQAILGCLLLDPTQIDQTHRGWFYDLRHQRLFDVLAGMSDAGQTIDISTVMIELQRLECMEAVGGLAFVLTLPDQTPSSANWSYYAETLRDMDTRRGIIAAAAEAMSAAYDTGTAIGSLIDQYEAGALGVRQHEQAEDAPMKDLVRSVLDDMESAHANQGKITGLLTGFPDMDRMLCGMEGGQVIVIAARPSAGKTALALNICENVAVHQETPVGVFSLEMTAKSLSSRLMCSGARVSRRAAKLGRLTERDFANLAKTSLRLHKAPIQICDRSGMTIGQLRAKARRWAKAGVKIIIIDYLQLLNGDGRHESRRVEVGKISQGLKTLAKEANVPVIVLSQLNRASENEEREPRVSDLRESGDIEQDADTVMLLHRPNPEMSNNEGEPIKVIVGKNRDGIRGAFNLMFLKQFTRFESMARDLPDAPEEENPRHND